MRDGDSDEKRELINSVGNNCQSFQRVMKHEAITVSEVGRGVSAENIKPSVTPEETLITGQTVNEAGVVLEEELLQTENKLCINPFTCRPCSDLQPELGRCGHMMLSKRRLLITMPLDSSSRSGSVQQKRRRHVFTSLTVV